MLILAPKSVPADDGLTGFTGWAADVIVAATLGAVLGVLVFYYLDAGSAWFARHGRPVVFFGRFVPLVRSVVSIRAGAQRMPMVLFVVLTAVGSGLAGVLGGVSGDAAGRARRR